VLSGSRGVKEASRQAVLQAAEALNYRPNMIAQSLLSQTTGCIGVICAQDNINQTTSYLYALENSSASTRCICCCVLPTRGSAAFAGRVDLRPLR
jgi:DNA-binding LacI/PurR family transcriptional regulator